MSTRRAWNAFIVFWFGLSFGAGCAAAPASEPEAAAEAYVLSVEQGDYDALWGMMSEAARTSVSKAELKLLLEENRAELSDFASELSDELSQNPRASSSGARFHLSEDEHLDMKWESGEYRVLSSPMLIEPSPRRPLDAVVQLKSAIAARNYDRLVAVLTPKLRAELSEALDAYEETLAELDLALVDIKNDQATVTFPGGTVIILRQVGGAWLISELP